MLIKHSLLKKILLVFKDYLSTQYFWWSMYIFNTNILIQRFAFKITFRKVTNLTSNIITNNFGTLLKIWKWVDNIKFLENFSDKYTD